MKNIRYKVGHVLRWLSILASAGELAWSLYFYISAYDFDGGYFKSQVIGDYGGLFTGLVVIGAGAVTFILDGIACVVYPSGVKVKNAEEDAEENAEPKRMFPVGFVSSLIQLVVLMLIMK